MSDTRRPSTAYSLDRGRVTDPALIASTRFLLDQMERAVGVPDARDRWVQVVENEIIAGTFR